MIRLAILGLAVAALLTSLHASPAAAERRVALVIGNSAYQHVSRLPNPVNDAEAVAALFRNAGFDAVEVRRDLGAAELRRAVRDFSETTRDADIAILYYAGHGIEVDGNNYLIPADARLASDFDVEDEAISLDRVLRVLEPARRLRLVILDACRDNPFAKSMKRSVGTRSIGRGLARVEPATSDTLIAFAAKAGSVAVDGDGANSPFTAALVQHIASPGLDLRIAFGRVRDAVLASTRGKQEPFVYGSLGGGTVSIVGQADEPPRLAGGSATPPTPSKPDPDIAALQQQIDQLRRELAQRKQPPAAPPAPQADEAETLRKQVEALKSQLAALPPPTPPAAAPKAQPVALPPQPAALDSLARNFLHDYMRRSEGDLRDIFAYLPRIYDREVLYYGKRTPARQVIAKKQDYFSRWSQRTYRLRPDMKIACDAAMSSCRMSGHLDYYAASAADFKVSSGVAYYEYHVVFSPSGPKIIEENSRTISRQN